MKQKIDGYARTSLGFIAKEFGAYLGKMEADPDGVVFTAPPGSLSQVRITNNKKKFLLGGLFALEIIGEIPLKGLVRDNCPIRLHYRGSLLKGKAYFQDRQGVHKAIVSRLNNDAELIRTLSQLDLEKGEIWVDDDKYTIKLSPLGGSYMYMMIPPLRYTGSLPKKEINRLYAALARASEILKTGRPAV
ncbi:DUF3156 family protein [Desulfoscipio gibsoniae]|uniref:DUF3156 family protein n=1 Tax=Desulfoscipio gibsoniae DSM 7213 TaxID=767817 RepID=R4KGF0_9FIRM|nr:DUF3156 family protein [Desulfoscipio gibsoniae]AGL02293.1 Protein of unknown function (DUF3156) [Desulfoscipio gibsoniae DSM 7213]